MTRIISTRIMLCKAAMSCLLLGTLGCGERPAEGDEQEAHYDPVPVHVATAHSTTLKPTLGLIGVLVAIPERTVIASAQFAGVIDQLPVAEGQVVHAGDTLARLDPRLAESNMARARAAVDERKSIVERLEHGVLPQEIAVARRDVEKSKANADSLRFKLKAMKTLRENDEISAVRFDAVESVWRAAQADHAANKARLELLEAGTRPESIAEAEAKLAMAQSDLTIAQLAVQFCHITSPIDGVITRLSAQRGMSVSSNTALATVVDKSVLFVKFRVPNAALGKVHVDAAVRVQLTAIPGQLFDGRVTRLSGQADPATGDIDAFATIANEQGVLYPGLSCRITVDLPNVPNALVVPAIALADRAGTPVVTVVRDNKAYEVPIRVGLKTHDQIQVLQGLSPGDTVITENGYGLPDDCPVKIMKGS